MTAARPAPGPDEQGLLYPLGRRCCGALTPTECHQRGICWMKGVHPDSPGYRTSAHGREVDLGRVERVARAINNEGAWCGVCGFDGWDSCSECRRTCREYARAAIAALAADTGEAQQAVERVRAVLTEQPTVQPRWDYERGVLRGIEMTKQAVRDALGAP